MPTFRKTGGRSASTFVIRILDTDDKEWVGIVSHVQSGRKKSFRGFIEAVRFIDGFVGGRDPRDRSGPGPSHPPGAPEKPRRKESPGRSRDAETL